VDKQGEDVLQFVNNRYILHPYSDQRSFAPRADLKKLTLTGGPKIHEQGVLHGETEVRVTSFLVR